MDQRARGLEGGSMNMTKVLAFAKFMVEESDGLKGRELTQVMAARFGDMSQAEVERGIAIGEEILLANAAEYQAEADAMMAELARRAERRAAA
ncbi:hypothetical protein [Phyllobacterium meliloti]|uniref:hypothetical protein n=1 Tax=Phyllobacterium meliloti TaxID=555317 RepID=UPI001D14973D|nr:hypothetical protein [Phyllobacterium sp. T1293]UGX88204.1 hypothetical protein LLE53_004445 [Phyllobacterium sp. T1293]